MIPRINEHYRRLVAGNSRLAGPADVVVALRTRPGQLLLRPTLTRIAWECCTDQPWHAILDCCTSVEIFNISTYQSNIAFDRKIGDTSATAINDQLILSHLSLSLALSVASSNAALLLDRITDAIMREYSSVNEAIYRGQFASLSCLTADQVLGRLDSATFEVAYIDRCRSLGGALTAFCLRLGAILAGADSSVVSAMGSIGAAIGIGGQILNDLADYIPPRLLGDRESVYRRAFSDISNGQVTLPLYDALQGPRRVNPRGILDLIGVKRELTEHEQVLAYSVLHECDAYARARALIHMYHNTARKLIKRLPSRKARKYLGIAASTLLTNKYLATLNRERGTGVDVIRTHVHDVAVPAQ